MQIALLLLALVLRPCVRDGGCPEELRGAWRLAPDSPAPFPDLMVRIEPRKVTLFRGGSIEFIERVISCEGDRILLSSWGSNRELEAWREEDRLNLVLQDDLFEMEALAPVPPELVVEPLPLGAPELLEPDRVAEVQAELARRLVEDQAVRTGDFENLDLEKMARVDRDNTAFLRELLGEVGWVDAGRFGPEAAQAAFLIVQHSGDRSLMLAALPGIEKDARAGRISGDSYALLHDRLALNLGEKQRYGSQVSRSPDGEMVVRGVEDPGRVDALRAELGMPPLLEYVRILGMQEVVYQDEE